MCITSIQFRELEGAAKGAIGWFDVTNVSVCNDHPHHAMFEWCINIDVVNDKMGSSARVALELTPKSARELAEAILQVVKETEAEEAELAVEMAAANARKAAARPS